MVATLTDVAQAAGGSLAIAPRRFQGSDRLIRDGSTADAPAWAATDRHVSPPVHRCSSSAHPRGTGAPGTESVTPRTARSSPVVRP